MPARPMFTSFLRLDLDLARQSGDLDKWIKGAAADLTKKQAAMAAFEVSPTFTQIPGGPMNLIDVKVFKTETGFEYELGLKRSAKLIEADVAELKAAAVRAAAEEKKLSERREFLIRAAELLKLPLEQVMKTPFPKVQAVVLEAERKQQKAQAVVVKEKKASKRQAPAPQVEFKPAQLTGRRVDLSKLAGDRKK